MATPTSPHTSNPICKPLIEHIQTTLGFTKTDETTSGSAVFLSKKCVRVLFSISDNIALITCVNNKHTWVSLSIDLSDPNSVQSVLDELATVDEPTFFKTARDDNA